VVVIALFIVLKKGGVWSLSFCTQWLIRSAVTYADEPNVYANEELIRFARQEIEASQRSVSLSVYVWDWPEDLAGKLAAWEQLGVERTFLTFWHPFDTLGNAVALLS